MKLVPPGTQRYPPKGVPAMILEKFGCTAPLDDSKLAPWVHLADQADLLAQESVPVGENEILAQFKV